MAHTPLPPPLLLPPAAARKQRNSPQKDKASNTVCFVNAAVASENEVGLRKYSF